MKILKLLPIIFILSLFSLNSYAEDCDAIKMDSSVNIIKKLKCKAGKSSGETSSVTEEKNEKKGFLSKIWKRPEWTKKKD